MTVKTSELIHESSRGSAASPVTHTLSPEQHSSTTCGFFPSVQSNPDSIRDENATRHRKFRDSVFRLTRPFRQRGPAAPSHSHGHSHIHSIPHSCGICCPGAPCIVPEPLLKGPDAEIRPSHGTSDVDVEKGPPHYQRFVLNIDGLKCGCCGTTITRAVSRISAIRDHQVNVILARLEFDLDINRLSIDEVLERLRTSTTGLKFEQNSKPRDQVLEFLHTNTHDFHSVGRPKGITAIELPDPHQQFWALNETSWRCSRKLTPKFVLDKCITGGRQPQLVRVHYDAKLIGARQIYEFYSRKAEQLTLAPPPVHSSLESGARQTRQVLRQFIFASLFTIPVLVLTWAPIDDTIANAHASLGLASIVQIVAWVEFLPGAFRSLKAFRVDMDFLISLSTTTAYFFSVVCYAYEVVGKPLSPSFFETSTLLVTLILLGRVINEYSRNRAARAISFRSLQIDKALLIEPGHQRKVDPPTKEIDARLLQYGDSFKVLPHTRIVTDGIVTYGGSEVDEIMLTGEAIPVAKGVHSDVYAGTMNGTGTLVVTVKALTHENTVQKIAAMVESAELTKPKVQALADKIAGWFVSVIAVIGSLVFLIWLLVSRFHSKQKWPEAVVKAITYAIATLIVSCPCAIGLAVPMVVLIAGGVAARYGIIFRDPQKLEIARNTTDVIFDKTGTLTTSYFSVISEQYGTGIL